jgi:SulP family sulfate permease
MLRLLPRRSDYAGLRHSWRGDVLAGLTVGVVALPLALAFGVTTGVGAAAGLVTAIVAGVVAAVFGGSRLQVSGPTGAMTVVLVPIVVRHGPSAVYVVAIIGGLIVLALGVAGFGRAVHYIPWPVIEGFTIGIALLIALQQVPFALDVAKPSGENTALVALRSLPLAQWRPTGVALALVALVAALMVLLPKMRRSLPASLIAVSLTTLLAEVAHLPTTRIGALPSSLPAPHLPLLDSALIAQLFPSAVAVAALAAIESLLSARVADGMSDGGRHDPDRELVGQGLANVASGLFGGMPATGAIARTAVNVRAGARTRVSAAVHAVLLIGVVYVCGPLVARIPLAALAGVLIVTATRMVERHRVRAVFRSTGSDAAVLVLTAFATVIFDLVVAVEIGVAIAALLALRAVARSSRVDLEAAPIRSDACVDDEAEHVMLRRRIAVFRLSGALFFGAAQRFLDELAMVSDVDVVILRLGGLRVLDATGANALAELVSDLEERGITVLLASVDAQQARVLHAVGVLAAMSDPAHAFASLDEAITHADDHVRARVG